MNGALVFENRQPSTMQYSHFIFSNKIRVVNIRFGVVRVGRLVRIKLGVVSCNIAKEFSATVLHCMRLSNWPRYIFESCVFRDRIWFCNGLLEVENYARTDVSFSTPKVCSRHGGIVVRPARSQEHKTMCVASVVKDPNLQSMQKFLM